MSVIQTHTIDSETDHLPCYTSIHQTHKWLRQKQYTTVKVDIMLMLVKASLCVTMQMFCAAAVILIMLK